MPEEAAMGILKGIAKITLLKKGWDMFQNWRRNRSR